MSSEVCQKIVSLDLRTALIRKITENQLRTGSLSHFSHQAPIIIEERKTSLQFKRNDAYNFYGFTVKI